MVRCFDKEIEETKQEILEERRKIFFKNNGRFPELKEILPMGWFTTQWGTGFMVVDLAELKKLKKTQRDKILKLGGL